MFKKTNHVIKDKQHMDNKILMLIVEEIKREMSMRYIQL